MVKDDSDPEYISQTWNDPTLIMGGEKYFCAGDDWLHASIQYQGIMVPGIGYGAELCVVDPPSQEQNPGRTHPDAIKDGEWIAKIIKCSTNKKTYTKMEEEL